MRAHVESCMAHVYTCRPLVEWSPNPDGSCVATGVWVTVMLQLIPRFTANYYGVLDSVVLLALRPANCAGVVRYLVTQQWSCLSHEVFQACLTASELGPSAVHHVILALATCRRICSDWVVLSLPMCVVAVA